MGKTVGTGSFGDIVFEVSAELVRTFEKFSRKRSASYADHETVTGKPTTEYTGGQLDEVEMSMKFLATMGVSPQDEIEKLGTMLESGEAHPLLLGDTVYGHFTLREMNEDMDVFVNGRFWQGVVTVTLKEYEVKPSGAGADALARDKARSVKVPAGVKAD